MSVQGKTIILAVTGGIAAYKAAAICSALTQMGADVRVLMSSSATEFIAPLTFQVLSKNQVYTHTFEENDASKVTHIDLADRADLVVVAPATANIIAKLAHGLADDMISTTLLATRAPIVIAPAMNGHMYNNVIVGQNMNELKQRGMLFIDPAEGQLACGYIGKGRLAEPSEIVDYIQGYFSTRRILQNQKVLITAGGTKEAIDPVRYIGNHSSGRMGYALAEKAVSLGAEVALISTNKNRVVPDGVVDVHYVQSAQEMYDAVMQRFADADIIIKSAAVADYRPKVVSDQKIKKTHHELIIELEKTKDILLEIGKQKTHQFIVGFAAETNDILTFAMDKLRRKNCDLLIANNVSEPDAGFGVDTNRVHLCEKDGTITSLPVMSKLDVAEHILRRVAELRGQ